MLEISNRALDAEELALLVAEIEKVEKKKQFHFRFTVVSLIFLASSAGLLLFFFAGKESLNLMLIACALIMIYAVSVIWGYKQNSKMFNDAILEIKEAISYNMAEVYKCFAEKCISFQNKSLDEPAHIFEVGENQLLFLTGFDFYGNKHFPNTDFEVVAIKKNDDKIMHYELSCKGVALKPISVLSDLLKKKLREEKKYPENLTVFPGRLEKIEKLLLS